MTLIAFMAGAFIGAATAVISIAVVGMNEVVEYDDIYSTNDM